MDEFLRTLDLAAFNLAAPILALVQRLLNYIESLLHRTQHLETELQQAQAEIARLKDLSPRPTVKPNGKPRVARSHPQARAATRPTAPATPAAPRAERIKVDRDVVRPLDRTTLPADFQSTGYREVVIQNIVFHTDNVRYRLERGFAPSTHTFYEADLPAALQGQAYGPELHAFTLTLYFELRVPEKKILALFCAQQLVISAGEISAIVTTKHLARFELERRAILTAGVQTTSYANIDDTALRVNGVNHHLITVGNPDFAAFFIRRYKNHDVIAALFTCERLTPPVTETLPLGPPAPQSDVEATPLALSTPQPPAGLLPPPLREAVKILVSDDAPQFNDQTEHHAGCWIHEDRLYDKLHPVLPLHQKQLEDFRADYWAYYRRLGAYAAAPTPEAKAQLTTDFDQLFSRTTGYDDLDHRLALTRAKKVKLLVVLDFPEVPLHNNQAERDVREGVIKRKISSGPRGPDGAQAWEVYFTLLLTCRRQGVNFYAYLRDRIAQTNQMPALADWVRASAPPAK